MAMDRGLIKDLDAPVFSYFPEYTDLRTPEKDRITLRGQFVLNHGVWEGKQIVPASWVAQSTAEQIKAREPFSYGYQWWLGRWR
jgi:CubicO group peptidase (beta-lactamase class C family)